MGLRFDPIGGGQFKQAVKQIMEAEAQPVRQLEAHKAAENAKLKLFQDFKSKFQAVAKSLDDVSGVSQLRELKVELGDGDKILDATIDKTKAQPGSYAIRVKEMAARTSVISNGFDDPDEKALGQGFIVMYNAKGDKNEIYVDESQSSLHGVAELINRQSDAPVTAAVVKDAGESEGKWKLIVSAKKDGADNQIDFPDFYFLDGDKDFRIDDDRKAQNAKIEMNGFEIQTDSNDIADFLPGVGLHLKQAKPEQPITMKISEDHKKISGKVKTVIESLNGVLGFINKQNSIDKDSDTRNTFAGDSGLQNIEYRVRNLMHEGFRVGKTENEDGHLVFMSEVGVEFDKSGALTFNEDKFTKSMEKNYDEIANAVAGEFGFAYQMRELFKTYTQPGNGLLALREQGFRTRIKDVDNQIDNKTRILERRQQSLTDQFSRLEASLSNMQRQQSALSATLGGGGGGNLVSQLLGG